MAKILSLAVTKDREKQREELESIMNQDFKEGVPTFNVLLNQLYKRLSFTGFKIRFTRIVYLISRTAELLRSYGIVNPLRV